MPATSSTARAAAKAAALAAATKKIVERWHATGRPMSISMAALSSTWHVLTLGACGPVSRAVSMQYEQAAMSIVAINMQYKQANLLIHLLPPLPLPPLLPPVYHSVPPVVAQRRERTVCAEATAVCLTNSLELVALVWMYSLQSMAFDKAPSAPLRISLRFVYAP